MYKIEQIKKIIDKYEYVSFDIFDTLIKRNVYAPSNIFDIVESEYKKRYGEEIKNFKQKRKEAEIISRTKNNAFEPNIDEIYDNLNVSSKDISRKLKDIEIEVELKICQKNKDLYSIYNYCIEKKKKIIIVSDMYLNKEIIERMLHSSDIIKYDYLFLSNDIKLNKHNGKIFRYILNNLNIKAKEIVHIGDSKRGDFVFARIHGIKSILIPKRINKLKYYESNHIEDKDLKDYNNIQSFINNNIDLSQSNYYKIGYEVLGVLLYGYATWLLDILKKKDIKKVFFLSREGYMLKKAFDIVNDSNIISNYLYVSRRSVRPALYEVIDSFYDFKKNVKIKETTNVDKFLKDVGLEGEKYVNIFKKRNYNSNTKIIKIKEMPEIFDELKNDIKENAEKEKKHLMQYLYENDFTSECAIADIGWAGSMQKSLCRIVKNNDLAGFYFASIKSIKDINMYSYYDSYSEIRPFVHLFENFFLAPHGTTIKYKKENEKIIPLLDEYEYSEQENQFYDDMQKGAICFINDFIKKDCHYFYNINSNICSSGILTLGLSPKKRDIDYFKDIHYVETQKKKMIEMNSTYKYFFNISKFKEDLLNSGWKIGALKKVFKINLPYDKIYNYLMKNKEKE